MDIGKVTLSQHPMKTSVDILFPFLKGVTGLPGAVGFNGLSGLRGNDGDLGQEGSVGRRGKRVCSQLLQDTDL